LSAFAPTALRHVFDTFVDWITPIHCLCAVYLELPPRQVMDRCATDQNFVVATLAALPPRGKLYQPNLLHAIQRALESPFAYAIEVGAERLKPRPPEGRTHSQAPCSRKGTSRCKCPTSAD